MEEKLLYLIEYLLDEMPEYRNDAKNITDPYMLLRSLMNLRVPGKILPPEFL